MPSGISIRPAVWPQFTRVTNQPQRHIVSIMDIYHCSSVDARNNDYYSSNKNAECLSPETLQTLPVLFVKN